MMKQRLERFYSAFGDRGVMFILFAFSVVVHAIMSLNMELPAVSPDEIGVASVAAFYSGRDWSAMMGPISYYYGYVQAVFYTPLFVLFNNPYALYKAMLVVNGVMVSLIVIIAYHLASKIGIQKVWQKVVIALCSGFYITYVAHSKFIWNEAICSLLPWLLVWTIFMAWDRKNKYSKFTLSMLAGFLCAVCYGAHSRLIAVVIAMALTLLIVRFCMNEKILNLPAFFSTMAVSFVAEHFCRKAIKSEVWANNANFNSIESEADRVMGLFSEEGLSQFLGTLFGHLYTFMTSTLGLGVIAIVVFVVMIVKRLGEWNFARKERHDDGTQVYEPVKRTYSTRLTVYALFGFFAVGGSLLVSVLFKFNSGQLFEIADLAIFGRYTDNVAPMAVFLALAFLFMYGYRLSELLWSVGVYAYVCLGFVMCTYPILERSGSFRESPILGLMPLRIGEDFTDKLTPLSYIIMSSVTFSVLALLIIFTTCTRRFRTQFAAALSCFAFLYTTVFAGFVYLPMRAEDNLAKTTPAKAVSELIYNDRQSPQIVVYKTNVRIASLVQFLNLNTQVAIVNKVDKIPDSCIIITKESTALPLQAQEYDKIGSAEGFTVYAYGEAAREFMKYKRASEVAAAVTEEPAVTSVN